MRPAGIAEQQTGVQNCKASFWMKAALCSGKCRFCHLGYLQSTAQSVAHSPAQCPCLQRSQVRVNTVTSVVYSEIGQGCDHQRQLRIASGVDRHRGSVMHVSEQHLEVELPTESELAVVGSPAGPSRATTTPVGSCAAAGLQQPHAAAAAAPTFPETQSAQQIFA